MLGGGLEPPCLTAYAPQTYVSAISPPELFWKGEGNIYHSRCVLQVFFPDGMKEWRMRAGRRGGEALFSFHHGPGLLMLAA